MLECLQATTYTTDGFRLFLSLYFQTHACVLCHEVHELRIHGYVGRLVRSHETWENEEILILVIICRRAKAKGLQYTKRMLPPFVIPECNINLEQVTLMYRTTAEGRIDYGTAAELLGTACARSSTV